MAIAHLTARAGPSNMLKETVSGDINLVATIASQQSANKAVMLFDKLLPPTIAGI